MVANLNEVLTGAERVLDTPLPTAYTIAISQIAWIYVLVLPFQLYNALEWITIPASLGKTSRGNTNRLRATQLTVHSRGIHHPRPRNNRQRNRKPIRPRRERPSPGHVLPPDCRGTRHHNRDPSAECGGLHVTRR